MKKRFLLLPLLAAGAFFTLSSYDNGYTDNGAGSNGSTAGCGGAGCHGAAGANTAAVQFLPTGAIVLDSAGTGTLVTKYTAGKTYIIRFGAANTTTGILPKWGFQLSSIKGAAASSSAVDAGTFGTAPTGTAVTTPFGASGLHFFGHTTRLTAGAGTGGVVGAPGAVDSTHISWTAPAAGTGTITMFVAINMVDGDDVENATDKWNRSSVSFPEQIDRSAVKDVTNTIALSTYPNPVVSALTLQMTNAAAGTYGVKVFDMSGKVIATQNVEVSGNATSSVINMNNFNAGVYQVVVEKDGVRSVTAVVKQ